MNHPELTTSSHTTSLLHHLSAAMSKQSDQLLMERLGVGFSQFRIMRIVEATPTATQRYIASQLGQTEASISRQVKIMQTKGLISMRVNPSNRREHQTILTPKGLRLFDEMKRLINEYTADVCGALPDKYRVVLQSTLETMHAVVCRQDKIGTCNAH